MKLLRGSVLILFLVSLVSACSNDPGSTTSEIQDDPDDLLYEKETWVEGLDVPWEIVFTDQDTAFVSERSGAVRIIKNGELYNDTLINLDVHDEGESGLLGMALHPDYENNKLLYIYYTYQDEGQVKNRVDQYIVNGTRAKRVQNIIEDLPGAQYHNGGRIKFGPDQKLYITVGEIYEEQLAKDIENHGGSILRLNDDGSIPEDNPFEDSAIYSWGHRNAQGLAWHPNSNVLFSSEHGQSAFDEINIIEPGKNYGWPIIEGDQPPTQAGSMEIPFTHSGETTWAPSGMAFVTESPWTNNLLVANLRGEQILKLTISDQAPHELLNIENLFKTKWGRIRNVVEGPDGSIYILTNNRDGRGTVQENDDRIIRLQVK